MTNLIHDIENYLFGVMGNLNLFLGTGFFIISIFMFYVTYLDWSNKVKLKQAIDFGTSIYLLLFGVLGIYTYIILKELGQDKLPPFLPLRWSYVISVVLFFRSLSVIYYIIYRPHKK